MQKAKSIADKYNLLCELEKRLKTANKLKACCFEGGLNISINSALVQKELRLSMPRDVILELLDSEMVILVSKIGELQRELEEI